MQLNGQELYVHVIHQLILVIIALKLITGHIDNQTTQPLVDLTLNKTLVNISNNLSTSGQSLRPVFNVTTAAISNQSMDILLTNTTDMLSSNETVSQFVPQIPNTTMSFTTTLLDAPCGITRPIRSLRVMGGHSSAFGLWPWMVSVRRLSYFDTTSTHKCGGTLLNRYWVITAAHCINIMSLEMIKVRVGEYDSATVYDTRVEPFTHQERSARRVINHPKFNEFTYEYDIALIQLNKPVIYDPHVRPICLPPLDLPPDWTDLSGRNATITGWGRIGEGKDRAKVLQEVTVPIVTNERCEHMFNKSGRREYIPDVFVCAGYDGGQRDACSGDSGGPLQVQNVTTGQWFLAGITSWGIGCGGILSPGVYTRVSVFTQWILNYIDQH